MSNNERIIAKIAALTAKTIENGATEAEANSAMEMAEKLMEREGITMEEILKTKTKKELYEDYTEFLWPSQRTKTYFELIVRTGIARLTDTINIVYTDRTVRTYGRNSSEFSFAFSGHKVDVELAKYIWTICENALEYEYQKWAAVHKPKSVHGRKTRNSFSTGMAVRLDARMRELKKIQTADVEKNALIVMKKEIAESFANLNQDVKDFKVSTNNNPLNGMAFGAGKSAADAVKFNKGIGDPTKNTMLLAAG